MIMKRLLAILALTLVSLPTFMRADDYIDDVYYSPEVEKTQTTTTSDIRQPYYNKKAMVEIIFINDTADNRSTDTVRAVIKR